MAKTKVGKWLDAKDAAIQGLKRQLAQQQEEKRKNEEQILELEEYVRTQEDYFANQMVEVELKSTVVQEAHEDKSDNGN